MPLLVPFTRAAVPVVDVPGGFVVVDPPAEIVGEDRLRRRRRCGDELAGFHVLTLFPGMFPGPLGESLAGRALAGRACGRWRR